MHTHQDTNSRTVAAVAATAADTLGKNGARIHSRSFKRRAAVVNRHFGGVTAASTGAADGEPSRTRSTIAATATDTLAKDCVRYAPLGLDCTAVGNSHLAAIAGTAAGTAYGQEPRGVAAVTAAAPDALRIKTDGVGVIRRNFSRIGCVHDPAVSTCLELGRVSGRCLRYVR